MATPIQAGDPQILKRNAENNNFDEVNGGAAIREELDVPATGAVVPKLVSFWGDSITFGQDASDPSLRWTTLVAKAMGWTENNLGLPASRLTENDGVASGLERIPLVYASPVSTVVMMYGINDLLKRTGGVGTPVPVATYKSAYDYSVKQFILQGIRPILVGITVTSGATFEEQSDYRDAQREVAEDNHITFVDTFATCVALGGNGTVWNEDYTTEGLHPLDSGMAVIADAFLARVAGPQLPIEKEQVVGLKITDKPVFSQTGANSVYAGFGGPTDTPPPEAGLSTWITSGNLSAYNAATTGYQLLQIGGPSGGSKVLFTNTTEATGGGDGSVQLVGGLYAEKSIRTNTGFYGDGANISAVAKLSGGNTLTGTQTIPSGSTLDVSAGTLLLANGQLPVEKINGLGAALDGKANLSGGNTWSGTQTGLVVPNAGIVFGTVGKIEASGGGFDFLTATASDYKTVAALNFVAMGAGQFIGNGTGLTQTPVKVISYTAGAVTIQGDDGNRYTMVATQTPNP